MLACRHRSCERFVACIVYTIWLLDSVLALQLEQLRVVQLHRWSNEIAPGVPCHSEMNVALTDVSFIREPSFLVFGRRPAKGAALLHVFVGAAVLRMKNEE
jgi:hypothetical protein